MSPSYPQATLFLDKLKAYALFAELLEYYLCKQQVLPAHLAEAIFVTPATISHWRKNRRIPDNLGILHQVTKALKLLPAEQEALVIAWCNTQLVHDLVPYIEEAMRVGDVAQALHVAQLVIGNPPTIPSTPKANL